MPRNFVDYVLDVETSGKRGWHGLREKWNPPRITQFGMIRLDPLSAKAPTVIVGGGLGGGWTNLIGPLVEKYRPLSGMKIPAAFWRELAAYDASVVKKGSLLNDQVRAHVEEYIALRKSGQTGEMKSAVDYIKTIQSSIQNDINKGNTVRLNAFSKGFDTNQLVHEMNRAGKKEGAAFMKWLDTHVAKGAIEIHGVEEGLHRGMFDVMMADKGVTPRFASSRQFDMSRKAGLKTVGLEATTEHHALREMMNDLKAMKGGAPAKQVLQGMPADIASELKTVKSYDDWRNFSEYMNKNPEAKKTVMGHYTRKAEQRLGVKIDAHVSEMGFEYLANWRQDVQAGILNLPKVEHRALADTYTSLELMTAQASPKVREDMARQIMTDESLIKREVNVKYSKYLEEAPRVVSKGQTALTSIAHRTRIAPPAGLSRLARSPLTLPIVAAAGGLLIADQLSKHATPTNQVASIREEMQGKIEGLRKATSQWDVQRGLRPSVMDFGNVSIFGSGRHSEWSSGSYKGVPIHSDINYLAQKYALNPQWQYGETMSKANFDSGYGPSREEIANQRIDLADYIYELKDADTILLRKAWLNQDVPLIGPAVGFMQRHLQNIAKTLTGQSFGFKVRVDDIDAPEVAHGGGMFIPGAQPGADEATSIMSNIMKGSSVRQAIFGGRATHIHLKSVGTYGRYIGTPMAGGVDLAGELVKQGGAISTSMEGQYLSHEHLAMRSGSGIWQHPEYQAVPAARKRGILPSLAPLKRYSALGRSIDAQAMHSMMVFAQNPHMHGVRDQHAQSINVRSYQ